MTPTFSVLEGLMFVAAGALLVLAVELRMQATVADRSDRLLGGQRKDERLAAGIVVLAWVSPSPLDAVAFVAGALVLPWLAWRAWRRTRTVSEVTHH